MYCILKNLTDYLIPSILYVLQYEIFFYAATLTNIIFIFHLLYYKITERKQIHQTRIKNKIKFYLHCIVSDFYSFVC